MLLTALTMGSLSVLIHHWEALRVQSQFNRDANQIELALRKRLDMQLDVMLALQQLQSRSPATSAEQWHELTSAWLAACPVRKAWAGARWSTMPSARTSSAKCWVACHQGAGWRRQYAAITAAAFLSAHPFQRTDPAQSARAGAGYPVSPVLASTIRRSMQSGQSEASPAIRLVQEVGQQKAVALYQAVYGPSDANSIRYCAG
jgi:CHASE1-domain containing sensor protein